MSAPGFGDVTSRDALKLIMIFLRFAKNTNKANYDNPTKLYKIFPILSYLHYKFQNLFLPGQNISAGKSLTLWKRRLSIKQYLQLKADKFGIQPYELCEYLWSLTAYRGKDTYFQSSLVIHETRKNGHCASFDGTITEKGHAV